MISYTPTPIQEIDDPVIQRAGVRLLIKREDLNHPRVQGNKWWKLKYNLLRAYESGQSTLLTFGGAYSNHLYAVAAAASELGMKSIGVVRGEPTLPMNPTLSFVSEKGMVLDYVSRARYREKNSEEFEKDLRDRFGDFYLIPEGGTNGEAIKGCLEFGDKLVSEIPFDLLCLPVGTGGTFAGLLQALAPSQKAIGFSALKDGSFLEGEVRKFLPRGAPPNWRIETRFDFGGYAKTTPALLDFLAIQRTKNRLPLDPVYTGKTLFGIYAMIESGQIPRSSVVLMVHTGGLQGAT